MVTKRPTVQAVIYDKDNEKFLIIGKKHEVSGNIIWRLVKGGIEDGETDSEALHREILEEVGLRDISVHDKVHFYEFHYLDMRHLVASYFVEATMKERVVLQGESEDESPIVKYAWLNYGDTLGRLFWRNEKQAIKNSVLYL
jgi:ADP-ribose pyrophosphatase YjhB (NUDIX family)